MSVIVISKKEHSAFKIATVTFAAIAFASLAVNIKMLTDVNTYKHAYETTASLAVDVSHRLMRAEEQNKELSNTILKKKISTVAASSDADCLAKNIYFEARGEPTDGKIAVAQVVVNRMKSPGFPKTACGVVYQGADTGTKSCQFSWACDGVDKVVKFGSDTWAESKRIATLALLGRGLDVPEHVEHALYFHNDTVKPRWATNDKFLSKIGNHNFYR